MVNWLMLHRAPELCRKKPHTIKQAHYYKQSRKRWLENQDGYETQKILEMATKTGMFGIVDRFAIYNLEG